MWRQESDVFAKNVIGGTALHCESECADAISSTRQRYDRCHPDDTFEDLKRRARFSKEDKGVLRDWMALAIKQASFKA
ncbi:MAG: hypothetical protein OJF62_002034 [Pseudolabrys sp.]|jgi:hypothetical protein|nr:hypothetical protein [Pseudolabrys sp.]